jgi:ribosomal protein S8E
MGITRQGLHKRRLTGGKKVKTHKKRKFSMGRAAANTKLSPDHRAHPVRCRGGAVKYRALRMHMGNYAWPGEGELPRVPCGIPVPPSASIDLPRHPVGRHSSGAQGRWGRRPAPLLLPGCLSGCVSAMPVRVPPALSAPWTPARPPAAVTKKTRILSVMYNASNNELVRTKTLVKSAVVAIDATPFRQWYTAHYGVDPGKETLGKKGASGEVVLDGKSNSLKRKVQGRTKSQLSNPQFFDQFVACVRSLSL